MARKKYLLDTHALIWFQTNNPSLSVNAYRIIEDPKNDILFSQISLFELAIKQKIGKLPNFSVTVEEIHNQAISDGFTFVSIQNPHLYQYSELQLMESHRDPFDRLIIATAIIENASILSGDSKFDLYQNDISIIW